MTDEEKSCEGCFYSRPVLSENGWHYVCTLKMSYKCLFKPDPLKINLWRKNYE